MPAPSDALRQALVQALRGPGDEAAFQQWYAARAQALGLNPNPDDPQHFYDYRAAFRAGAEPDASGHWPSQFKLEGHPRLILDGVDTRTGEKVNRVDPRVVRPWSDEPAKPPAFVIGVRG